MKQVLVIGSMNMDYTVYVSRFPKEGETLTGEKRIIQPGGKGANMVAAIGKSGLTKAIFVSSSGNDNDGKNIINILQQLNVQTIIKQNNDIETGNATIIVNENGENKIIVVPGANHKLKPEDIDINIIKESDYIVIQNEILEETNEFIIKKAKEYQKILFYNPAPYRDIKDELISKIDYLILNKGELIQLSNEQNVEDGMTKLLKKGIKNILVTLGSEGSLLKNKNETIKVAAKKVKAIDTVAAGDTYTGYFISALASGKNHQASMEIATKASAITVSREGSIISIPFGKEIL